MTHHRRAYSEHLAAKLQANLAARFPAIAAAAIALLCAYSACAEAQIVINDPRKAWCLSGSWEFVKADEAGSDLAGAQWKKAELPFGKSILPERGRGLFLRNYFTVSSSIRYKQLAVYTGLIRYAIEVYINGESIGAAKGMQANDYPGGVWDTLEWFSIPSNLIRFDEENTLILLISDAYQSLKLSGFFISGIEEAQKSFFIDHFRIKITHFLAGFVSIFIFLPLLYFFLTNKKQKYYLYIFIASIMYALYGMFASFDIPPVEFLYYNGILMCTLSLALAFMLLTINSYYSSGSRGRAARMVILFGNIIAASVFFFLKENYLKQAYYSIMLVFVYLPQLIYAILLICYHQVAKREKLQPVFLGVLIVLATSLFDVVTYTLEAGTVIWMGPIGVIIFDVLLFIQVARGYIIEIRTSEKNAVRLQFADSIKEETERLDVTLDSITDAVICTDTKGRVTFINKAAIEISNTKPDELSGKGLEEILDLETEDTDVPAGGFFHPLLQDNGYYPALRRTCLIKRSDGRSFSVLLTKAVIKDRACNPLGAVWVFHDITEQEKLEQVRRRNQTLESLGHLASGIAHDFNNIFMQILINTGLAKRAIIGRDRGISESFASIEQAVTKASLLTHQLLTFAKGGTPLMRFFDVRPLIMASASYASHGSDIRITYNLAPDLWTAEADAGLFSQVIYNLVLNSIQAMPQGGTIEISGENAVIEADSPCLNKGAYDLIKVKDDGIGIKKEHISRVFDPYFTTKQNGTGLGLTSVLSIIKKHNGYIEVESCENKGTVFSIYLHAKPGNPAEPECV